MVFARRGYHDASLEEIAAEAGGDAAAETGQRFRQLLQHEFWSFGVRKTSSRCAARRCRTRSRDPTSTSAPTCSRCCCARDEDGQPLSDLELRDELMTMLLAGHETTATNLAFDLLGRNPQVLERLRDELAAENGDAYLDAIVTETLDCGQVLAPLLAGALRPRPHSERDICDFESGVCHRCESTGQGPTAHRKVN